MTTHSTKSLARVAAAVVAAGLVGVGAAAAQASHVTALSAGTAVAANHCTHYSPPTSTDYNCNLYADIAGTYLTSGTAMRDNNHFSLSSSRSWTLAYTDAGGSQVGPSSGGYGQYGTITGSSGNYWKAACYISTPTVSGECDTAWHD